MHNQTMRLIRMELLFAPILIFTPLIIASVMILNWYIWGYLGGDSSYNGEVIIGGIIFVGNILFDIPFVRSLIRLSRKKRLSDNSEAVKNREDQHRSNE